MSFHATVTVSLKLDPAIKERLHHLGEMKQRSAHWLMKEAIAAYVAHEEEMEQLKQETLNRWQEAQQGKVVTHAAVSDWLDTWSTDNTMDRPECGS